jgi:uncharacterized protein YjbK
MFYDVFFDTEDFTLAKQNLWLRERTFEGSDKGVWSLKACKIETSNIIHVYEFTQQEHIVKILQDVLENYGTDGKSLCDDPIIGSFLINPIGIFTTNRVTFEDSTETVQKILWTKSM